MHWLAVGEPQLPAELDWLSETEAARLAGMRFTKRRNEYLLRRRAGKLAVAAVTGRPVDAASLRGVELLNLPTGAPLARLDGRPLGRQVSLTDRAGWAVGLVGDPAPVDSPGPVGIDLEIVEPRSPGFVQDFLTDAEQRYVGEQPDPASRQVAANLLWSAKEAALKVLQTGLRADTRTVQVSVGHLSDEAGWHPLRVQCRSGRGAGAALPGWWRRDGVFVLTIVCDRAVPPPSSLPGGADLASATPVHSWLTDPERR
jgi:4'-phosphopantetheinyl transferase